MNYDDYEAIERLADKLLEQDLKSKKRNKSRTSEYPILSKSQMKRRQSREIPYSNLSNRQKLLATEKYWDYEKGDEY